MGEEVHHPGQLAIATPLGQITCDYSMLMLNVTDQFSTFPTSCLLSDYMLTKVKAWFVVNWI